MKLTIAKMLDGTYLKIDLDECATRRDPDEATRWPMLVWNFLTQHVISGVLFDGERVCFNDERDVDKDLSDALLCTGIFKIHDNGGLYMPGKKAW